MSSFVFSNFVLIFGQITITLKGLITSTMNATTQGNTCITILSLPLCSKITLVIKLSCQSCHIYQPIPHEQEFGAEQIPLTQLGVQVGTEQGFA